VTVPVDHDAPGGPSLDLALTRIPATDPGRRLGSILVNPGGPGASGTDFLRWFRFDDETMARYDLVGFDPRGIGASAPLACEPDLTRGPLPDTDPATPRARAALEEWARALAEACAASDGELLPHLDSVTVARDLETIRTALGEDRLNFYGFSYGSLLALRYLELHPERAGRIVLDGVVDPTAELTDLLVQQAAAFDEVFAEMVDICATAPNCPPGGLDGAYDRLAERLREAPVGAVGPTELATAAIMASYDQRLWSPLRDALDRAVRLDDFDDIEELSDLYYGSASFGAYAAVTCTDTPVPGTPAAWDREVERARRVSARFGAATINELRACAHWPVRDPVAPSPIRAEGSPPVLVIGTTGDAATPLVNAETVAATLADGHLLVLDGPGHTAYGANACVDGFVREYFAAGALPPPGARC
jgi:pimeloyl-ACP methyl ester carboxylesterase